MPSIFPNPKSCLHLVFVLHAKLDDKWMTGKCYLNRHWSPRGHNLYPRDLPKRGYLIQACGWMA